MSEAPLGRGRFVRAEFVPGVGLVPVGVEPAEAARTALLATADRTADDAEPRAPRSVHPSSSGVAAGVVDSEDDAPTCPVHHLAGPCACEEYPW